MQIKILPSFYIMLSLMTALGGLKLFIFVCVSALFHELIHILTLKSLKIPIKSFEITAFGGKLITLPFYEHYKIFLVYSLGFLGNFFLALLCKIIAENGFFSQNFFFLCTINLALGVFNFLPIFPLDGYFVLKSLLSIFLPLKNAYFLMQIINFSFIIILFIFSIFLCFYLNFSMLFISFYLVLKNIKNL